MDVNFYAYIMTASHALPALKKSRGSIIVLDSNMGKSSIFYAEQENWSLCLCTLHSCSSHLMQDPHQTQANVLF